MRKFSFQSFVFCILFAVMSASAQTRSTQPDPSPGIEYQVVYQIGRFDAGGVFHGTDYNDRKYVTMSDCADHFDATAAEVREKAAARGAGEAIQEQHAKMFQSLYACQEITIDPDWEVQKKKVIRKSPPQPQEPLPATSSYGGYVGSVDATRQQIAPTPQPNRAFWVAEYISTTPGYRPYWVREAIAYPNISLCYAALKARLEEEQSAIEARFTRSDRSGAAALRYSQEMATYRQTAGRRFNCITDGHQ